MSLQLPWTIERVGQRLVEAYGLGRGYPVLSDRGHFSANGQAVDDVVSALSWPSRYIADPRDRLILRTWASCRATGESVRKRYEDMGWPRNTADRRQRAALSIIVAGLNRDIDLCNLALTVGPIAPEPVV